MPVVEIPQHRAIAPDSKLKAVTIAEYVILVLCFDCLELAAGKAKGWSRHESFL